MENAVSQKDFERAQYYREQEVSARENLQFVREKFDVKSSARRILVNKSDIDEVVSKWTGVPITSINQDESDKLLRMEGDLHRRVISQEKAISAISRAIRRSRAGLKNPNRPVGSFIFLGPTGVGKTELARALANFLFGSDNALIRFDMSEYMEKHSVSKLIGSPPGYVGHEEGGQLTEKVKRNPYSVVLLDEIEKAHPDIFNILLQVFEDGHLTDGLGNRVNFKNTIIIMTSNIGARFIQKKASLGFQSSDSATIDKNVTDMVVEHTQLSQVEGKKKSSLAEASASGRASPSTPRVDTFAWDEDSTYVRRPPYFDGMPDEPEESPTSTTPGSWSNSELGDLYDISPAGAIKKDSPAGAYLADHVVEHRDFNSYGSRRGNHEVMSPRHLRQHPAAQSSWRPARRGRGPPATSRAAT